MPTIIITVAVIWLTFKLLVFGIRAVWGVVKALCSVLLLPMLVVWIVYIGLVYFAVPIIITLGFVVIIVGAVGAILRTHFI